MGQNTQEDKLFIVGFNSNQTILFQLIVQGQSVIFLEYILDILLIYLVIGSKQTYKYRDIRLLLTLSCLLVQHINRPRKEHRNRDPTHTVLWGSFPSHLVRTVKLRVRISSVTDAAALRRGYRALSNASPSTPLEQQSFRGSWRQDLVNNTGKTTP